MPIKVYSFGENKIEQCFIDNQWFVFEKLNINCTIWDLGCYFGVTSASAVQLFVLVIHDYRYLFFVCVLSIIVSCYLNWFWFAI